MRKFILILGIFGTFAAKGQNVTKDAAGNYIAVKEVRAERDSVTGKTFTDVKGQVFQLYRGAKGGLYYWRRSVKGNMYRVCIKQDQE